MSVCNLLALMGLLQWGGRGSRRVRKKLEGWGVRGGPAGHQEIGDWTDARLLYFEAGTHVSERVR